MPTYNYYCEECDDYFEFRHGMSECVELCIACESSAFSRVPSVPAYIQRPSIQKDSKTGDLVEEYIRQNKKSVKKEKDRLKKTSYKKGEE